MNIKDLVGESYETSKEKGWHDRPATFGDRIALCHSELSEALEAFREMDNDAHDSIRTPIYRSCVTGYLVRDAFSTVEFFNDVLQKPNKPEGVSSELADVVIRIADLCGLYGIDLEKALREKMDYNKTRPYRHGNKRL